MMSYEYATFEKTASQLEANPELHAKFLNTLSLLEYMGARKILKSQNEEKISSQILAHAAEEIRHAQTFKRLALKMSEGKLTTYSEEHLLCGKEAREYFQSLDQTVHSEVGEDSYLNYLYTTLLIEERANLVYPVYEPVLARAGHPGILKAIVREENSHLKEILESLKEQEHLRAQARLAQPQSSGRNPVSVDQMIEFRMFETAAFEKFISRVSAVLEQAQPQASPQAESEMSPVTQPGLTRADGQNAQQVTQS